MCTTAVESSQPCSHGEGCFHKGCVTHCPAEPGATARGAEAAPALCRRSQKMMHLVSPQQALARVPVRLKRVLALGSGAGTGLCPTPGPRSSLRQRDPGALTCLVSLQSPADFIFQSIKYTQTTLILENQTT